MQLTKTFAPSLTFSTDSTTCPDKVLASKLTSKLNSK